MLPKRRQLLNDSLNAKVGSPPSIWVRAPGRVELMGSHTDYNRGFVLTMATDRDTWIAARPRTDKRVTVTSLNRDDTCEFCFEDVPLQGHWSSYMHGVLWVMLMSDYEYPGFDAIVHGNIPLGSGLSSSASLSVATAKLVSVLGEFDVEDLKLAQICRQAENDIVGVPCGILDQYSSVFGQAHNAMLLDCNSLTHQQVAIPPDLQVVVCDTCAPRQLVDSAYAERRSDCEQATCAVFGKDALPDKALRDATMPQLNAADIPDRIRARAQYVLEENQRVLDIAEAFGHANHEAIHQLCDASFQGADVLYEIVTEEMRAMRESAKSSPGVVGVRNSGGGFGGCLVAFVKATQVDEFIAHATSTYERTTGIKPQIFCVEGADGANVLQ